MLYFLQWIFGGWEEEEEDTKGKEDERDQEGTHIFFWRRIQEDEKKRGKMVEKGNKEVKEKVDRNRK